MAQFFANNVTVYANKLIKASDTEILVNDVAYLPNVTGGDFFLLTFFNEASGIESGWEVVKVTAINYGSNTITVVRSQEGTTSRDFAVGTKAQMRATAGTLDKFKYDIESKLDDAQATASGLALLGASDVAAQRSALGLANHQLLGVSSAGVLSVTTTQSGDLISVGNSIGNNQISVWGASKSAKLWAGGSTGVLSSDDFRIGNLDYSSRVNFLASGRTLFGNVTDDGVSLFQCGGHVSLRGGAQVNGDFGTNNYDHTQLRMSPDSAWGGRILGGLRQGEGGEVQIQTQQNGVYYTSLRIPGSKAVQAVYGLIVPDCADDAAAATAGVPVGAIYRTGTTLKVRAA